MLIVDDDWRLLLKSLTESLVASVRIFSNYFTVGVNKREGSGKERTHVAIIDKLMPYLKRNFIYCPLQ
jgi:hypothetical protein